MERIIVFKKVQSRKFPGQLTDSFSWLEIWLHPDDIVENTGQNTRRGSMTKALQALVSASWVAQTKAIYLDHFPVPNSCPQIRRLNWEIVKVPFNSESLCHIIDSRQRRKQLVRKIRKSFKNTCFLMARITADIQHAVNLWSGYLHLLSLLLCTWLLGRNNCSHFIVEYAEVQRI